MVFVRALVHVDGSAIGRTVRARERRRPPVNLEVSSERPVVCYFRRNSSLLTLATMKAMFAGRSASLRIRYGYQWVPNGT